LPDLIDTPCTLSAEGGPTGPPSCVPALRLHDLTYETLCLTLAEQGVREAHAPALWRALHFHARTDLAEVPDFSPPLQRWLQSQPIHLDVPEITAEIHSHDGLTQKLLLKLDDGQEIETVIMGYAGRRTACLSTQAGCAMGCVFCATGQMGFVRHLRPGEIVAQALAAQRLLRSEGDQDLRNLVLMGMGEPLHNYDSVMTALDILTDRRGLSLSATKISISTVGHVPGILRMAEEMRPYNLAVSLHATTDEARSAIMPANRRWPLSDLVAAFHTYQQRTGRRIFIEWTLIDGKNDSLAQAQHMAELLAGLDAHVNLIPLNPTPGYEGQPTGIVAADEFQRVLQDAGFPCTIRQRRGIDVAAGCGQLKAEKRRSPA
jgi:23S rRNA (adenine2503-C2)-methyltransferase